MYQPGRRDKRRSHGNLGEPARRMRRTEATVEEDDHGGRRNDRDATRQPREAQNDSGRHVARARMRVRPHHERSEGDHQRGPESIRQIPERFDKHWRKEHNRE